MHFISYSKCMGQCYRWLLTTVSGFMVVVRFCASVLPVLLNVYFTELCNVFTQWSMNSLKNTQDD